MVCKKYTSREDCDVINPPNRLFFNAFTCNHIFIYMLFILSLKKIENSHDSAIKIGHDMHKWSYLIDMVIIKKGKGIHKTQ